MSNRKLTKAFVKARTPAHDPLSLESLIAWLETMPPEGRYDYNDAAYPDTCGCLGLQYAAAVVGHEGFRAVQNLYCAFDARTERVFSDKPWTVAAALSRARALQQGESDA